MALYKEINNSFDGEFITYAYHRVVSVTVITNVHNVVEICSYRTEERRNAEKLEIESGAVRTVFSITRYINMPYTQDAAIASAYNYLKTLPEFEGSEDI